MMRVQGLILLAVLFSGCGVSPVRIYDVVVDYDQSYRERISTGYFHRIDLVVFQEGEQRFPVEGEGRVACRLELIHFNREVTSKEAEAELRRRGLRPARIEHAIALASQRPGVFTDCRDMIVALGSSNELTPGHLIYIAIYGWLYGQVYDPSLVANRFEDGHWPQDCRFLALR